MKRLILLAIMGLALLLASTNGYAQCKIVDAKGKEIRSADCAGALLRVEVDKFIYMPFTPAGWAEYENMVLPQYFTGPSCQGYPNLYSVVHNHDYFYEIVQYADDQTFYYAQHKAVPITGSAIQSFWDGWQCWESAGWFEDSIVFTPLAVVGINVYKLTEPFKMSR